MELTEREWLTDQQAKVFAYLFDTVKERGYQPSFAEICAHLGFASNTGATVHINSLIRKGWLEKQNSNRSTGARSLRFLRRPDGHPFRGFVPL